MSKLCDSIAFLPQPLFSLLVVSYFYCPAPLHELVSGTASTRSSSFLFKEILWRDFAWTCSLSATHIPAQKRARQARDARFLFALSTAENNCLNKNLVVSICKFYIIRRVIWNSIMESLYNSCEVTLFINFTIYVIDWGSMVTITSNFSLKITTSQSC